MTDSFVFYRSFHEALKDLPPEQYGRLMYALNEYALNGEEPELSGVDKSIFTLIKPQIDANNRRKNNGALGGRPKENKKPMVIETETIGYENENHRLLNEKPNENDNVNANVNDNANLNANGNAEAGAFPPLSPPQEDFSKQIFDIFKNAGLPCCNGNYATFIQRDFKLALPYLRGLRAEEVIAASQNYAMIFQRPDLDAFWAKQKSPFDKFAEKKIRGFLPENFSLERYLSAKEKKWGAL